MLPAALKAWREERKLSQKDLAVLTGWTPNGNSGVSPSLIAMIESGDRQPSRLNADDIAAALRVPLEAIAFVYPDALVAEVPA